MSFRVPSQVSATMGSDQTVQPVPAGGQRRAAYSMIASRTTPTAFVFVRAMGPSRIPDSRTQCAPVISPLPLSEKTAPKQGVRAASPFPRGRTTVTPVRTASPRTSVSWPTSTPGTSVMAFQRPGAPKVNGIPRSRARGASGSTARADETPASRQGTSRSGRMQAPPGAERTIGRRRGRVGGRSKDWESAVAWPNVHTKRLPIDPIRPDIGLSYY